MNKGLKSQKLTVVCSPKLLFWSTGQQEGEVFSEKELLT